MTDCLPEIHLPRTIPLRAIVVDDEPPSRALIREFLTDFPDIQVIEECSNGFEALKTIATHQPDLVFLDIQMPKLSGFDLLELIDKPTNIIFITAYDQYAVKAFEVHALDYLLKPVSRERFREAVQRAIEQIRMGKNPIPPNYLLRPANEKHLNRILIKDGSNIHIVPTETIDFIEAQDDYICIHCGKTKHLKLQTLGNLEKQLDPIQFVRIHRSYIINIERLARIDLMTKDSRIVFLRDGTSLPLSRSGYEKLKYLINR